MMSLLRKERGGEKLKFEACQDLLRAGRLLSIFPMRLQTSVESQHKSDSQNNGLGNGQLFGALALFLTNCVYPGQVIPTLSQTAPWDYGNVKVGPSVEDKQNSRTSLEMSLLPHIQFVPPQRASCDIFGRHEIQLSFPACKDAWVPDGFCHQPDGLCILERYTTRAPTSLFMKAQVTHGFPDHISSYRKLEYSTKLDGASQNMVYLEW